MKKINKNKEDENQDLDYNDPIYRENILDHYRNPRNFGELKTFSASFHAENTVCGDELNIELLIINEKIKDAKFIGKGCAVSMASVSMLIEKIIGEKIINVKKLSSDEILQMLGINLNPTRLKCAILSLKTLQGAIQTYESNNLNNINKNNKHNTSNKNNNQ